ncbi:putative membrane permease [Pseudohyphozyma bogoriensis]|nr:putative membrane permease [Pseudohyphozyma bogoriensis]
MSSSTPAFVTHVVAFKYKPQVSTTERHLVASKFLALQDSATFNGDKYIISITGGLQNSNEGLHKGMDHVFVVQFGSVEHRDYYDKEDAAHGEFKVIVLPVNPATLIVSAFAAFTHEQHNGHPGVALKVLVVITEAFLASLGWGYAFSSRKGDLAGAAVLVYTLWGIYDFQTSSKLIHYFGLGAFIVSLFALVKSLYFTFQSDSVASTSDERAPLVG